MRRIRHVVIGIVGLSTVFAFWRGLIRVVMSLVALVAGGAGCDSIVAISGGHAAGDERQPHFPRYLAAFALIFVAVVVIGRAARLGALESHTRSGSASSIACSAPYLAWHAACLLLS